MRTIRKLSFFGILIIVIGFLFLIGMSTTQAQDQAKGKPDKPPGKPDKPGEEATWAVRIPTQEEAALEGRMFYGMDSIDGKPYYLNNDKDIEISVKKEKMAGPWKKYYDFLYAFKFSLTNNNAGTGISPDYFVGFQDVGSLDLIEYPDPDKPCCQFPGDPCAGGEYYECNPYCLAAFLNNTHPYSDGTEANDYEFFWIRYTIFDFDIEQMGIGDDYLIGYSSDSGEPGDSFLMKTQYRQGCQKEPAFHNVELRRTVNYSEDGEVNIWIERLNKIQYESDYGIPCEKVWRIRVEVINGNDYLCVKETYCTPYKKQTFYTPIKAKGNFFFYVDFIKNPNKET